MIIDALHHKFISELKGYSSTEAHELWKIFGKEYLGLNAIELSLNKNKIYPQEVEQSFDQYLSRLNQGEPYQHIIGKAAFFGLDFKVSAHTLIPRPETEELLELAIEKIRQKFNHQGIHILDIGSGSGVIPIILKHYFPKAHISSIDISADAQKIAKQNAQQHKTSIQWICEDYLNYTLDKTYDVIISNPPYIGLDEEKEIESSVKDFEPKIALFSPTQDALIFYRKIAQDAKNYLNSKGLIFLEINQKLGAETLALFQNFSHAELIKDLSQNDRFVVVEQ